jgi:hypothetical protein
VTDSDWLRANEAGDTLRLEWENRRAPRDHMHTGCVGFLVLVFAPLALVTGCVAAGGVGPAPWYGRLLAALGTAVVLLLLLGCGYKFLAARWTEWLEVSPAAVVHGHRDRLAWRPAAYRIGPGSEWSFGRYEDEGRATLGLTWVSSWGSQYRAELAEWLSVPAKEQVFLAVARFVEARQIPLAVKRYYG